MAQKVMEKQVQDRLRNLFASKKNAVQNEIEEVNFTFGDPVGTGIEGCRCAQL